MAVRGGQEEDDRLDPALVYQQVRGQSALSAMLLLGSALLFPSQPPGRPRRPDPHRSLRP
jgi:hypothetical protein